MPSEDIHVEPFIKNVRKPSGSRRQGQQPWNAQRGSAMPTYRYVRDKRGGQAGLPERTWPSRSIEQAPLWCSVDLRDGNQSLVNPMTPDRKRAMFELLVRMGFKNIEAGYPAASDADFTFVRDLIRDDLIPEDVTISVFTPARPELIQRTFDSLQGIDKAVVHLCLATACLWREVVFGLSAAELKELTISSARQVATTADSMRRSEIYFEYSPETFNVTEPDYALEISEAVTSAWDASPDRPVVLNLPSTVETDSPNVYADQIEWMHRHLDNRNSVILSVHPHNDRGTAVAAAELAIMAGADRVEGTLFGNGERTGNVCLATLALNLFSTGIDPQLDFSDIDSVRHIVELCNQLPVHARQPYAGDLVYTAFSGTHQDGIAKGLAALEQLPQVGDRRPRWKVPYLPIDPGDVGRTYEAVIRLNSQSGKGGVSSVLYHQFGLDLPRGQRIEFAKVIQHAADQSNTELTSRQVWDLFRAEYLLPRNGLALEDFTESRHGGQVRVDVSLASPGGHRLQIAGQGADVASAFAAGLRGAGCCVDLHGITGGPLHSPTGPPGRSVSYAEVGCGPVTTWGTGIDAGPSRSAIASVVSALNRLENTAEWMKSFTDGLSAERAHRPRQRSKPWHRQSHRRGARGRRRTTGYLVPEQAMPD